MKRILLYITAITFSMTSCTDFLDQRPVEDYTEETILKSVEGMNTLLNGIYDQVSNRYYYGAHLFLYEAAKGPDFFVRNVSGGSSYYNEQRYSESSAINGNARNSWLAIYNVIRNATILIENIEDVGGNLDEKRRIKGEAYALRGLAYFDLMRQFSYPPIFSCTWGSKYEEQFKWGVPIIEDVETGTNIYKYEIRRKTADSTYNYIVEQFENAQMLLDGRVPKRGHVSDAAVLALRIRAHLYMEQWSKVIELGEEWIARFDGAYSMIPYETYPQQYYKTYNSESLWEIAYTTADNLSSNSLNTWVRKPTYMEPGSERDGKVSQNVGYAKLGLTWGGTFNGINFLENYANDIRKYLICELGIENHPEYRGIRRYVGDPVHSIHNIPVVRLPEVYLSLAEAYYMVGDTPKATEYTTRISQPRRKAAASLSSVTSILNERRREFILEGHTYWDHFRTARNMTGRQIIESISSTSISFGSISGVNYRTVYPIPLAEMNANKAIRDQQNPGYAAWRPDIEEES